MSASQIVNHQQTASPAPDVCWLFRRMDWGERFFLTLDLADVVTDLVFYTSIDEDESLRYAVLACACLGFIVVVMKLVWLRMAYARDFDAWDLAHGLSNLGYATLFVEDIPQVIFVLIIGVSGDIAVVQVAFTMMAIFFKCAQDWMLANGYLATDLTGKRKTVCQYCCQRMFGESCMPGDVYEPKGDIEDGGASLPATPREQRGNKAIDIALLTSSPLLRDDQPITPQINPQLVKRRLADFCTKAVGRTEKTVKFTHYTSSITNFQIACIGGAKVIHYSGQTFEGKLAFEMDPSEGVPGECLLVDGDLLKAYIKEDSCKLAFVASSRPRFAGQVFVDAGVQHVVCIYSEESKDQACANEFTASFYMQLISGETVKKAYDVAIANAKAYPGYDENNFMLIPNGGVSGHDVIIFDANEENSLEGFQDRSNAFPYRSLIVDDGYMLGREQLVANIIPRVMRFSVNVIVGPDKSNNTALMMATSNYLVDRYCFTKGAHYFNILPQRDDPYSYCLDLILAQAFGIDIPDAGNIEKDIKVNLDVSFQVLEWLRDQESNDDVGLNNCLLLCFDGLRSLLVDTEFDQGGVAFISTAVRNKNLKLLKEMIQTSSGLRILTCTSNRDVHQLMLDSGVDRVNPTTTQTRTVQPSESLHL